MIKKANLNYLKTNRKILKERNALRDEEILYIFIWISYGNIDGGLFKFGGNLSFFK